MVRLLVGIPSLYYSIYTRLDRNRRARAKSTYTLHLRMRALLHDQEFRRDYLMGTEILANRYRIRLGPSMSTFFQCDDHTVPALTIPCQRKRGRWNNILI